jgi:6-phosphogluconolactonase
MDTLHEFSDKTALASALARSVAHDLRAALARRARASLVVSGGRTPVPFLERLAREPLEWPRVDLTLADERWVPADHADSNEGLVRRHLLRDAAAAARFAAMKNDAPTAAAGAARFEAALQGVMRPFDVVVLGMGDDGHVASLFPAAPQLPIALGPHTTLRCMAIDPPAAPYARLSLTLAALLDSRRIVLLITGASKSAVLQAARAAGPVEALPVRAILRQAVVPVDVYWSPDER